ncbi:MAG: hypothetical protein GY821_12845 [Gammaproteobacteria bacterium]|nr:hypothetical protein [Gammaproteobacteria bacterium]
MSDKKENTKTGEVSQSDETRVIFCECVREIDNGSGNKNFCRACGKEIEKI